MVAANRSQEFGAGVTTEDVSSLISDPDEALRRWYRSFMRPASEESVLTGGTLPPLSEVAKIFDRWFDRRRSELRALLCHRLHYHRLEQHQRETLEITTIALVSTALITSHLAGQIDPVATAVLLVSRRSLDHLCDEGQDEEDDAKEEGDADDEPQ